MSHHQKLLHQSHLQLRPCNCKNQPLDPPLKLHYWNGLKSEFYEVLENILSVVCLEDLRRLIEKWYELNHILYFIRIACLI